MSAPLRLSAMAENASPASGAETTALAGALMDALVGFAGQLRWLGLDLSIVELTDALRAVQNADLLDRGRLRRLLRITMVKRSADLATFDAAFDLPFPAVTAEAGRHPDAQGAGQGAGGEPADLAASPALLSRLVVP